MNKIISFGKMKRKSKYYCCFLQQRLRPYVYRDGMYPNTFVNNHPIDTSAQCVSAINKIIYCFWTGNNELTPNRLQGLRSLREKTGVQVQLITPHNLAEYILPDAPLHPAYDYLSLVHKSDYLRCYFMYHYGGGYSDVKACFNSWDELFDMLSADHNGWILGYPELHRDDIVSLPGSLGIDLKNNFTRLIGNGAYICRPSTPITREWYSELIFRMDRSYDKLKQNVGNVWGDNLDYPLRWSEILGDIFHPLCLKYHQHLIPNAKIRPNLQNYR